MTSSADWAPPSMPDPQPEPAQQEPDLPTIPLAAIVAYIVLACGLAWLVALPLWLGRGLAEPIAVVLLPAMMFTPLLAVLIVMLAMRPVAKGWRLWFLGGWPLRPTRRIVWLSVIAVVGTIVVVFAAMFVAIALGWLTPDFAELSGLAQILEASAPPGTELPSPWVVAIAQLASIPIAAFTVNAVLALGEEIGWRGFLVPALRRYGTWPALIVSGIVWGLWHAPVILLGYNFARPSAIGLLLMVAGCLIWGVLLGLLRLRSGAVWPAVFAHGAMNASMGLPMLFFAAGSHPDPALMLGFGASGWIAGGLTIAVLLATGQFRRQHTLAAPMARPRHADPATRG